MANSDANKKGFDKDSVGGTLVVAFLVCLVCAIIVSSAAVALRPIQTANIERDRQKNILAAAGLYDAERSVEEQFSSVETKVVDLRTGTYSSDVEAANYDHLKAAKNADLSSSFSELDTDDIAKIGRRENYALIYLINDDQGRLDKIILPVRGYGLWSTMQGFIALEEDATTVAGIGFFAHLETPGLGGEIDNPAWKAVWPGKKVYDGSEVALDILKGSVVPGSANVDYQIDGLAGATLTTKGVDNLVKFWLGDHGFSSFLDNLKAGRT